MAAVDDLKELRRAEAMIAAETEEDVSMYFVPPTSVTKICEI